VRPADAVASPPAPLLAASRLPAPTRPSATAPQTELSAQHPLRAAVRPLEYPLGAWVGTPVNTALGAYGLVHTREALACARGLGFGKQTQGLARLDLEVSAGWVSPSSRNLCGGDALLLSTKVKVGFGARH
jgi:hypothetical protein